MRTRRPAWSLSPEAKRIPQDPSTGAGEQGRDLPEGLDSEEFGRLRGFLRVSQGAGCASAVAYAALTLLLRDRRFAELLALAAFYVVANARALRLVGRGKGIQAAIFWSWMTTPIVGEDKQAVGRSKPRLETSVFINEVQGRGHAIGSLWGSKAFECFGSRKPLQLRMDARRLMNLATQTHEQTP